MEHIVMSEAESHCAFPVVWKLKKSERGQWLLEVGWVRRRGDGGRLGDRRQSRGDVF